MILGLAIPRLHMTWYASKLELIDVKETDLAVPKKGKPINNKDLQKQLTKPDEELGRTYSSKEYLANHDLI
jgi:hypothetical protein